MRLMIASDIHGSAYYCEKMLKIFENERADKLLLLGDILYHGPRNDLPKGYAPKEVIKMLNPLSEYIIAVRGNCEAEVDQMVLDFPVTSDYILIYDNGKTLFATHGHIFNEEHLPLLSEGDILLNGHTHIPKYKDYGKFIFVNPGSVSIPKENSFHSSVIYEAGDFHWIDIESGKGFSV